MLLAIMLYADDGCFISTSEEGLSIALLQMETFCDRWALKVNAAKSKIIVFSRKVQFRYKGELLEQVPSFRYLGIEYHESGSWNCMFEVRAQQARMAIMSLKQKTFKFDFNARELYRYFVQLVDPVMHYGAELWGCL